jgi:hypothetical protein
MEQDLSWTSDERLRLYEVGVRIQQTLVLQDEAEATPTTENVELFREAVRELSEALDAFGSVKTVYEPLAEEATELLGRAYREWTHWNRQRSREKTPWSPMAPALVSLRDYFIICLHHLEIMTWDLEEDELNVKLIDWFRLGLAIAACTYDEKCRRLRWDNPRHLKRLLSSLGVDFRDLYSAGSPVSIAEPGYRTSRQRWANIDYGLHLLQQGGTARSFLPEPDYPLAEELLEDDTTEGGSTNTSTGTGQPPGSAPTNDHGAAPFHDEYFRFVNWYGTEYKFTVNQASCVQVLWESAADGVPVLSQGTIMERALGKDSGRLRDVFKSPSGRGNHPAFGTMIVRDEERKGMFKLSKPVPPAARTPRN